MKKVMFMCLVLVSFLFTSLSAQALVSVRGYYRSNGTYVAPHYRTSPDSSIYNNFSYNGIKTTGLSYGEASSLESYLNGYGSSSIRLSKREQRVQLCMSNGISEQHCKAVYMKKHK